MQQLSAEIIPRPRHIQFISLGVVFKQLMWKRCSLLASVRTTMLEPPSSCHAFFF